LGIPRAAEFVPVNWKGVKVGSTTLARQKCFYVFEAGLRVVYNVYDVEIVFNMQKFVHLRAHALLHTLCQATIFMACGVAYYQPISFSSADLGRAVDFEFSVRPSTGAFWSYCLLVIQMVSNMPNFAQNSHLTIVKSSYV
jgi:hypothetical protein